MAQYDTTWFEKGLAELEITLNEKQIEQFLTYYELLVEWNKVMNLTAITEYEEVITKHFLDSVASVKVCDYSKPMKILDLGTGAGFPGIPLKIAFPDQEIVLLDSLNKRVKFLNTVIETLGLTGIRAIHGRAEDYARQADYRERFDLCVSRAVANLSTLSEYCLPYVKVGGHFIPYKSGKIQEELTEAKTAIKILGGNLEKTEKFQLADTDMESEKPNQPAKNSQEKPACHPKNQSNKTRKETPSEAEKRLETGFFCISQQQLLAHSKKREYGGIRGE